ncbi:MAG: glycerate kinase [Spirochaetes bacterium]|nr:glycerate kinase [Spirochaetota bacterium]
MQKDTLVDIWKIYTRAIEAVDPYIACKNKISVCDGKLRIDGTDRVYNLSKYNRVFVVGAGKATASMARAVEEILGKRISSGCISVKHGYTEKLRRITQFEAAHPVPDENGMKAARTIYECVKEADENDLVISLISGGGSALLPLPAVGIDLKEMNKLTQLLLASGAPIDKVNCVRKHISMIKGGNLARAAFPATVLNLMISDVVGDDLDVIASGPFVPDSSSFSMARNIIQDYGLTESVPDSVSSRILDGCAGRLDENPGINDLVFKKVDNVVLLSNRTALKAAKKCASDLGYNSLILSSSIEGDAKNAVDFHVALAKEVMVSGNPVKRPACLLSGGESGVVVTGEGRGGRNTEFTLRAMERISNLEGVWAMSLATDGTDGPTDAAGAIVNWKSLSKSISIGLDVQHYLSENDSYGFFEQTGELLKIGPTNTNVMDMHIFIVC